MMMNRFSWRGKMEREQKEYDQACKAFNQHLTPYFFIFLCFVVSSLLFYFIYFLHRPSSWPHQENRHLASGQRTDPMGVMLSRENRKVRLFWDLARGNGDNHPAAVRKLEQAHQRNWDNMNRDRAGCEKRRQAALWFWSMCILKINLIS